MTLKCAFSLAVRVLIGIFLVGLVTGFALGLRAAGPDIPDPVPATVTTTTTPATETAAESVNFHRSTSGSVTG
jgi:hypothetical protein